MEIRVGLLSSSKLWSIFLLERFSNSKDCQANEINSSNTFSLKVVLKSLESYYMENMLAREYLRGLRKSFQTKIRIDKYAEVCKGFNDSFLESMFPRCYQKF